MAADPASQDSAENQALAVTLVQQVPQVNLVTLVLQDLTAHPASVVTPARPVSRDSPVPQVNLVLAASPALLVSRDSQAQQALQVNLVTLALQAPLVNQDSAASLVLTVLPASAVTPALQAPDNRATLARKVLLVSVVTLVLTAPPVSRVILDLMGYLALADTLGQKVNQATPVQRVLKVHLALVDTLAKLVNQASQEL